MFGRKAPSAVGANTRLRGDLECGADDLLVGGVLEGTVTSGATVTVVSGGQVTGDVNARIVVVGGLVTGTVTAQERLIMRTGGRIEGDARYGSLEVERGGVIEGRTSSLHGEEAPDATPAPALLTEGDKGGVEETMRFHSGLLGQSGEPAELSDEPTESPSPVSLPARRHPPPRPRDTDSWGAGASPDSDEGEENDDAAT